MRKMGKSYVVDETTNNIIATSFKTFAAKQNWGKEYAKEKREQLLKFIAAKPDKAKFAIVMGNEIYLTEEGEKFVKCAI